VNVYTPKFEKTGELQPDGRPIYRVVMVMGKPLKSEDAEDALAEAKRMGVAAPIVG
jgi:hypothetical protein